MDRHLRQLSKVTLVLPVNSATRTPMSGYHEAEADFIADNPG